MRISIPNALNIGFAFNSFNLSANAEMYIFNESRTVLDSAIKKSHFTNSNTVSIASLKGNSVIIYIVELGNTGSFQSTISIQNIIAGFQELSDVGEINSDPALRPSVNCNPLIQCQQSKIPFARAVARFTSNGFQGTGTLINNELNNGRAYFLTAFHVLDVNRNILGRPVGNGVLDADEIAALTRATFQFQFWRTACSVTVNNAGLQFTGAVVRAAWPNSDAVLLELTNPPGIGDLVNYAGWNRQVGAPSSNASFIIHHPQGADMRITSTRNVKDWLWNTNYWTAHYSSGTVDRGSSGSALMNEFGQIVGQLRSGWSSCNYTDFGDRYGKISQSWLGTGQPNGNLQNWLSPVQNQVSTGLLNLTEIPISGPNLLGCSTPGTFSTLPGLLDVTYEWVVSSNMQVVSGQNTPSASISFTNGTYGFGTITLILRSPTKGRNREYTVSKTVTRSAGGIQGTYNSPSGGGTQLNPAIPKQFVLNNACVGEYIHCSMSIPPGSIVTWAGSGNNWYQNGNDLFFYLTALNQQATFSITVNNSCGTKTTSYNFVGVSGSCGGSPLRVSLSPNPSPNGTVTASLINILDNSKINIKEIKIIDKTGNIKKHLKFNGSNINVPIDVSNLNPDIYTIMVYDGKIWLPGRLIKN